MGVRDHAECRPAACLGLHRALDGMATEPLWKLAIRRGIESARRQPRRCNVDQACALSAFVIERMRIRLANGENLTEEELNRRVSVYRSELARVEQRAAATRRQVMVTVRP
jgi:hypothetical protein